jgi:hypothetical protein
MNLVREHIDFERKQDPLKAMDVGKQHIIIDSITSEDLYAFVSSRVFSDEIEDPERFKVIEKALKKEVTVGEYFDWKEDDKLEKYLRKKQKDRFVYNTTPEADGVLVVFSKIKLPSAEEIEGFENE